MKLVRLATIIIYIVMLFVTASSAEKALCACPMIYAPVCASNGKTYVSTCSFKCETAESLEKVRIVTDGACENPSVVTIIKLMKKEK
ncbi:hypothetical protein NQ314_015219 [Rhamnusium bicolor]|uniref:Kazal-like domain-containing protein n=1 Tax=Rhamnusium bicolor TaxID=1586634 RepID=A0AAV8WYL4_9CUCU|nr:hypothetical protein NQ314_015219 [Rhamnusium bicolor]